MRDTLRSGAWSRVPLFVRAIALGLCVGMIPANVWPVILVFLRMPAAAAVEVVFLAVYVWWACGGGWPRRLTTARGQSFRIRTLSAAQWRWGLLAAVMFAATVHAAIVVLFRLVPFPAAAFHAGYDLSFIPSRSMQWLAVVVSAASAGICEETGFRGYMQQPMEKRYGTAVAVLVSSFLFMLLHLTKDWSTAGMVPIVFGAGLLLGTLAWASRSLVFCMIGHTIMDIGLFAYWWTQIAGTFAQRPISATGIDPAFYWECATAVVALIVTLAAIARLRTLR